MPDITDDKKNQIRKIAEKYCYILSKIPFEEGVSIYSKTYQSLYIQSARWRFCLLCGEIKHPEDFRNNDHKCSQLSSDDFPTLVKTSWIKLEEFFLSQKFLEVLKEGGIIVEEE
ncbi:MAG: hypothetical protein ACFFDS_05165 [Candidatus Thorarchaeota archaeon]